MTDIPLPEGVTPQAAAQFFRDHGSIVFQLIGQWQRGDIAGASERIHGLSADQARAVIGGLVGMAKGLIDRLAEEAEVEPEMALDLLAGTSLRLAGEMEDQ